MGFDLVSVLLNLAGLLLGLEFLYSRLSASRGVNVSCELHDQRGM